MLDFREGPCYDYGMENVKAIVSQNILRLRKENNLTQAELARRINYSDKAISRWEAGEVVPDLETIYALSEIFDVPVSQITEARAEGDAQENQNGGIGQKILSQIFLCCEIWFILTALYVYLKLPPDQRLAAVCVVCARMYAGAVVLQPQGADEHPAPHLLLRICLVLHHMHIPTPNRLPSLVHLLHRPPGPGTARDSVCFQL